MRLFDSHAHLDDARLSSRLGEVIERAHRVGVVSGLAVSTSPRTWTAQRAHAARAGFSLALGVPPHALVDASLDWRSLLAGLEVDATVRAIGECGLDGALARSGQVPMALQREALDLHVEVAEAHARPLVVHAHGAVGELLAWVRRHGVVRAGAVLHAFGGPAEIIPELVARGFVFGVGTSVTWAASRKPKDAARAIPRGALLLESDAPFARVEGDVIEQARPEHVLDVACAVAALRNEGLDEVAGEAWQTAGRLGLLPDSPAG